MAAKDLVFKVLQIAFGLFCWEFAFWAHAMLTISAPDVFVHVFVFVVGGTVILVRAVSKTGHQ